MERYGPKTKDMRKFNHYDTFRGRVKLLVITLKLRFTELASNLCVLRVYKRLDNMLNVSRQSKNSGQ